MWKVPKTTFMISDSLRLTELRKAVLISFMVYYNGKIEIKISKRNTCTGQGAGEARQERRAGALWWGHTDSADFSQQRRVTARMERLQPGQPTEPWPPGCLLEVSYRVVQRPGTIILSTRWR